VEFGEEAANVTARQVVGYYDFCPLKGRPKSWFHSVCGLVGVERELGPPPRHNCPNENKIDINEIMDR
jgi:hypothetical protein